MTTRPDTHAPAAAKDEMRRRLLERRLGALPSPKTVSAIRPLPRRDVPLPLSFGQERLWFLDRLSPESAEYLVPVALRLRGELDADALAWALSEVVARHEILRTRYTTSDGEPRQVVDEARPVPLRQVDLSQAAAPEDELDDLIAREGERGFDLERGPILRATLARLGESEHVLLVVVHHIAFDGWSAVVLGEDVGRLYASARAGNRSPLPPLPLQYGDAAWWQRRALIDDALEHQLAYWRERLEGVQPLGLPTDRPAPSMRDPRGASWTFDVPADVAEPLLALGRGNGATPFMTLLAPFVLLLSRYARQEDVAVGTPIATRQRSELEPLIGFFVNTLVLRLGVDPDASFLDLLARTRDVALEAYGHKDLPFERLVDELQLRRDLSQNPLFQVLFVLQNTGTVDLGLPDLDVEELPVDWQVAKFSLTLQLEPRPDGGFAGDLEYATALFDEATVARIARGYVHLLGRIVADPGRRLHELWSIPAADHEQIVHGWNDTRAPLPRSLLHEEFEERARHQPDAPACAFDGAELTYGELATRTTKLARHLRRLGVGPESVVAVCLDRGIDLVVALLGVMRAGGAYLPLDPEHSHDRLAFMVDDAQPEVVLTSELLIPVLPSRDIPTIALDRDRRRIDEEADEPFSAGVEGPNLAYVIYTSGSTGRPKGVMVGHDAISNRIAWMQRAYRLDPSDRVLQKTPFSFDVSVWEFFWPLVTGAQLVVAAPGGHRDDDYLSRLIQDAGVTVCHFVPSILRAFLEQHGLEERCRSLRLVVSSGEELRASDQVRFFQRLDAELHNLYGPTEAAVDVSSWACRRDDASPVVPIGRPIDNVALYVLDDRLDPVPIGVRGDIYIGGVGLARGYLRRPGLTAERFVPNPFAPGERLYDTGDVGRYLANGAIEYVGRSDFQVKIRGFRIELGEIEMVLGDHPGVASAVVDAREDVDGSKRLVAYVVPLGAPPGPHELRAFLAERLPEYMVPATYVSLDSLPLTSSGKTERKALPEPGPGDLGQHADYVPPRTPEEELVAGIWSGVLGVDAVAATDGFFDLGGDSIRAIAVVGAMRSRGFDVSVQDLFLRPTVSEFAEFAGGRSARATDRPPVAPFDLLAPEDAVRIPDGICDAYPLSRIQAGMVYEMLSDSRQANYHNVTCYWVKDAEFSLHHFQEAARIVTSRHEILRTAFDLTAFSEPLQLVYPHAEVQIGVEDLRGLGESEQQERVRDFIAAERASAFDLGRPPLFRLYIHVTADDAWQMSLCECHAILDGWSHNSFVTELLQIYRACRSGEPPKPFEAPDVRFADFVALEREALRSREAERFWRDRLDRFPPLRLPRDGRRTDAPSVHEQLVRFADLEPSLRRVARAAQVPFKSVLHAAHLAVAAELTGQRRFFTGLVAHGRPELESGDRVRGLFLNTLPFAVDLDEAGTWKGLAQAAFTEEIETWPHRRFPLPEMQRRWGGDEPLIEVLFTYIDFHVLDRDLVDLERTVDASPNEFPLQAISDFDGLLVTVDGARLDPGRLDWICERYRHAFERIAAAPDEPITAAPGGSPAGTAPALAAATVPLEAVAPARSVPPRTPLEAVIAEVWCELLAVDEVGVHDVFRDLGGDSLLLLRAAAKLHERGVDVAPRHVLERRTIARLAELIEQARVTSTGAVRPETFRALVWLKEDGAMPPLFCVHPGGGSTHWFVSLAERLDHAVAAFEAPGLAGEREPFAEVEEAALLYSEELRRVQPKGPYHLFSWCGGSGITMEMASRLRAEGEDVVLVLLDPAVDGGDHLSLSEQAELFTRCERLYARLAVGLPDEEARAARKEIYELLIEGGVLDLSEDEVEDLATRVHVWRVMARSLLQYAFRPYEDSLLLLVGDEVAAGEHSVVSGMTFGDYLDRWRGLIRGDLEVGRVGGDHFSVLEPPSVDTVADFLTKARRGRAATPDTRGVGVR